MLYFLYGTDTKKARAKLHELLDILKKKKPIAEVFRIESEQWDNTQFEELLWGQGLFEQKYIVVFDHVLESAEAKERIVHFLKEVAASDNMFICIENTIDAPTLKKLQKHAYKVEQFEEKKNSSAPEVFNMFSLTDAFGARDKKKLWVLYRQALDAGAGPEEIQGMLFWQLKSMIIASQSGSAEAAGLKPFVYQKAKGYAQRFSLEELQMMSGQFVDMYHNARRGLLDMDIALEKFVLEM